MSSEHFNLKRWRKLPFRPMKHELKNEQDGYEKVKTKTINEMCKNKDLHKETYKNYKSKSDPTFDEHLKN